MTRRSAQLLQGVVVLVGVAVLTFLLWEPHLEGRNAHATTFEIYFEDPFLAYLYVGFVPFFLGLHRTFRLLGDFRLQGRSSPATVVALRSIQRCAIAMVGFVAGGVVIMLASGDPEDRPQGLVMSFAVALAASAVAITAAKLGRRLQRRERGHD